MVAFKTVTGKSFYKKIRSIGSLFLILYTGSLFSTKKNMPVSFTYEVTSMQQSLSFQKLIKGNTRYYEMPLHDGDLTVFIAANTFKKLVNPYPSNLNATKFMQDNAALLDESLYFLDIHTATKQKSFAVQNLVMGVGADRHFDKEIAIGQVFYVMAKSQDGVVRFNNSQRMRQNQKGNQKIPKLKIGLKYTNNYGVLIDRQLGVSFKKGNSYTHDSGYDSELVDLQTQENDMYWAFGNGKKYVIAGLSDFDARLEIPLVLQIKSEDTIRLFLDLVENIKQAVYLYDKVTHKKVQLTELGVSLNIAKGTYTDRFYIGFHSRLFTVTEALEHQIRVSYSKKAHALKVDCDTPLDFKNVTLLKLLGKEVAHWKGEQLVKNALCLPSVVLKPGVYLVKIETDQGVVVKKMEVKNE